MFYIKNKRGFTLIELLVVISIIGLLSSIVLSTVNSTRIKAEDAKRLTFVKNIERALEVYFLDNNQYPPCDTNTYNPPSGLGLDCFEDQMSPYIELDLDTPLTSWLNAGGSGFYYKSHSGDGYQTYGMFIRLMDSSNNHFEQNDGGRWPQYYELGQNPSYCQEKYGGSSDSDWYHGDPYRCIGGN